MKLIRKRGDTSNILQIFIQDSSSTTGAGLTGLVFNSSSLTAYYHRDVDTTATAITLVTMTVGTFTSSGFKEIDATNMPGWYQFCPPDAALSATSTPHSVGIALKGATNMMPLNIEIQLVAVDVEDTVRFGLTALPNVASGSAGAIPTTGTGSNQISVSSGQVILQAGTGTGQLDFTSGVVKANTTQISGTAQTARDIGASVLLSAGTGTGQLDFTSGVVKANLAQILGTALTETAGQIAAAFKQWFNVAAPTGTVNSIPNAVAGASGGLLIAGSNAATTVNITGNITGNLSGSVGSVTGAVGSVTGAVGSVTGNVGGNVAGSVGSVTAAVTVGTNNDKTGYALTSAANNAVADATLARDMSAVAGAASRSLLNAIRFLRNKWSITGTTLTVTQEDDSTSAWTATVSTDAAAIPVVGSDPA